MANAKTAWTIVTLLALIIWTGSASGATVATTPIGTPSWMPVDLHMFSAPTGTEATGYAEFLETILSLLPEPEHRFHPDLGVGPGDPHAPPYDTELATGISNRGFAEKSVFSVSEFSSGMAVYFVFMAVPVAGSPLGSSPDFSSGPIIPNSLFPIQVSGETHRNGITFSQPFSFEVPALTAVDPPFAVEGHSHIPFFFNENFDFALNPANGPFGSYEFRLRLVDQSGSGWQFTAPYQVVPEPGTVSLLAIGAALLAVHRRKLLSLRSHG